MADCMFWFLIFQLKNHQKINYYFVRAPQNEMRNAKWCIDCISFVWFSHMHSTLDIVHVPLHSVSISDSISKTTDSSMFAIWKWCALWLFTCVFGHMVHIHTILFSCSIFIVLRSTNRLSGLFKIRIWSEFFFSSLVLFKSL